MKHIESDKEFRKHFELVFRGYKKERKAIQQRISIEKDINKRLVILLKQCHENIGVKDSLLRQMVGHELEMLKYKYY